MAQPLWVTVTPTSGQQIATLNVELMENTGRSPRAVVITGTNLSQHRPSSPYRIIQKGTTVLQQSYISTYSLTTKENEGEVIPAGGSEREFNGLCNASMLRITSSPSIEIKKVSVGDIESPISPDVNDGNLYVLPENQGKDEQYMFSIEAKIDFNPEASQRELYIEVQALFEDREIQPLRFTVNQLGQ